MTNLDELNEQIERNKSDGWLDLSDQQKLFGLSYVETYSIKSSAEIASVSANTASKWLRLPLVLEFINDLQSHLHGRSVITKDFVALQWLKLMPKLLGEEDVSMVDKDGCSFMTKKFHASESVSLLKELSKSTDFYGATENATNQPISISIVSPNGND